MRILVTGATGFVGRSIARRLLADGHQVTGLSRRVSGSAPGVDSVAGDVTTGRGLDAAVRSADAVIHLVGIIREEGDATYERVHVAGTRNLLKSMAQAGVPRLVHMSALGAQPGAPSKYQSSKAAAEQLVRASGFAWTIIRPSLIFGIGDDFFSQTLRNLVRLPPVVPVVGRGDFPFRPVAIQNVVAAFSRALELPEAVERSFDLTGPREYTLRELLLLVHSELESKKLLVNVPLPVMHLGVQLFRLLPNPPITRDELLMLLAGNTGEPEPARSVFGLELLALEDKLGGILAAATCEKDESLPF